MGKKPAIPTLLVVDDEPAILYAFREVFQEPDVRLLTSPTAADGLAKVSEHRPNAIVLDVNLPDMSGLDLFRRIHEFDAKIPVIFITAHGKTETAIEAMKLGALDYLLKPFDVDELTRLVGRAFEISRLMRVPAVLAEEAPADDESADVLIGRCPAMQKVYKSIGRVASQDMTVLVLGESGTGKELVARAIYHHSNRSSGPFLAINCAAIPETLLESELFGHEKGSFTGADRKRIGKFEQCNGGTLFLDEIGDMTPLTQTKILRVLQEQRFERVGGNETIQTDVRVITATNRNLEELVAAGRFRGDLYYRLRVYTIELPPLRERGDDLPLLVEHFTRRFNHELGKEVNSVSVAALDLLRQYPWPGNVREMQSVLKQAILETTGPVLIPDFLPVTVLAAGPAADAVGSSNTASPSDVATPLAALPDLDQFVGERVEAGCESLHGEWMSLMERHLLLRVLQRTEGNQAQAAKLLGIDRGTLREKIRSLQISIDRAVS